MPLWSKANDNPATYVTCPFNFRRALMGFPKTYFGCALCFATVSLDFDSFLKTSPVNLAMLIKSSVSRIKNDFILNSLATLESFRRHYGLAAMEEIHLRHPQHGMIVTNLTRLPIRDIDFVSGAPDDFIAYAEILGSAAILPATEGVEVLVVHPSV